MQEIELKFLEVNPEEVGRKLEKLGAVKEKDEVLEEWIFMKPEWKPVLGRVRVRKSETKVELAYKETTQKTGVGNLEIEFEVSDAEAAGEFVKKMGVKLSRHQQKRRISYRLGEINIDVDFWPRIPPMVEIEGEDRRELEKLARKLGFDLGKVVELDAAQIYRQVYGIDINEIEELVFE